jgi:hypothetical protein
MRRTWVPALFAMVILASAVLSLELRAGPHTLGLLAGTSEPSVMREWSDSSGGLRVTLTTPESVRAGQLFDVRVEATDTDGRIRHVAARFEPERPYGTDLVCTGIAGQPQPTSEGPDEESRSFFHAYRTSGRYEVRASAGSGGCDTKIESVAVSGEIEVLPATVPTNGPMQPKAEITHEYYIDGDPTMLVTDIGGTDPDGYVTRVELDWGDGSDSHVNDASLDRCEEKEGDWPDTYLGDQPKHRYPENGTYRLTLTVTSVGCDGGAEQTDVRTETFSYPPTQGT